MTRRLKQYVGEPFETQKAEVCELLLGLDKLGFTVIFIDEFKCTNYMHHNYNWCPRGSYSGVPLEKTWKSLCCIAAVSSTRLVKLSISK